MTAIICAAPAGGKIAASLGMGIGAAILIIFALTILSLILGGIFMYIGAGMAKVEKRTFGKAVLAYLLSGLGGSVAGGLVSVIPVVGIFLGFIANILIQIVIIKAIFETETGKAVLTWLFGLIAQIIVMVIAAIIFWSAIIALFATISAMH